MYKDYKTSKYECENFMMHQFKGTTFNNLIRIWHDYDLKVSTKTVYRFIYYDIETVHLTNPKIKQHLSSDRNVQVFTIYAYIIVDG